MPIYRTTAGTYVGTQADAGKGFDTLELPKDKVETLALLNEAHSRGAAAAHAFHAVGKADPPGHTDLMVAPESIPDNLGEGDQLVDPKAPVYEHMTAANILRRMDAMLAANRGAGAIADYVALAPPEEVALVAAAVAMRLKGAGEAALPPGQVLVDDRPHEGIGMGEAFGGAGGL